jgi:hypothetical protein
MLPVKTKKDFLKEVERIGKQQNAKLFHCYVSGHFFVIATAIRVEKFDFSSFKDEVRIIDFIQEAIKILERLLPRQLLLFSENYLIKKATLQSQK